MTRTAGIAVCLLLAATGCRNNGGAGVALGDAGDNSNNTSADGGSNVTDPDGGTTSGSSGGGNNSSTVVNPSSRASSGNGGSSGTATSGATSGVVVTSGSSGGQASSMVVGPACGTSRDCQLGDICSSGQCVPGCQSNSDCPNGRLCDTAAGPNGTCVQCLSATDCQAPATACDQGICRVGCDAMGACPNGLTCRTDTNLCVRCIDDTMCGMGRICDTATNACVMGCRMDSQCRVGQICDASQCVPGCHASPNTCPAGSICHETPGAPGQCLAGCNTAADCGDPAVFQCNNNQCVRQCTMDSECATGSICTGGSCVAGCRPPNSDCVVGEYCTSTTDGVAGQCLPGCDTAQDCGGQITNVCDVASHACVECLVDMDCAVGGPVAVPATCNANHQCDITCDPAAGIDRCRVVPGFHCSTTLMPSVCVQCDTQADCGAFETCTNNRCISGTNLPLCAPCTADADCGGPNDLCVQRGRESVCGTDCSAGQACPAATTCLPVGGQNGTVPRGYQCLPFNSVQPQDTCQARTDMMAHTQCAGGQDCGLAGFLGTNGDAICSGAGGSMGMCSVLCTVGANDCPDGWFCDDPPDTPQRVFPPRCSPL